MFTPTRLELELDEINQQDSGGSAALSAATNSNGSTSANNSNAASNTAGNANTSHAISNTSLS